MLIAQGVHTHIVEFNGTFAAAIHEQIAMEWMKFCGGDDFGEFFHVGRLDIHNVYER